MGPQQFALSAPVLKAFGESCELAGSRECLTGGICARTNLKLDGGTGNLRWFCSRTCDEVTAPCALGYRCNHLTGAGEGVCFPAPAVAGPVPPVGANHWNAPGQPEPAFAADGGAP